MDSPRPPQNPPARSRHLRILVATVFCAALIALLTVYGAARSVLSPQWVREHIVPALEQSTGRQITFEDLGLSGGTITVTGLHLSESAEFSSPKDGNIVVVDRVELSLDKSALLGLRLAVDRLVLTRPYLRLGRIDDARWNITTLIHEIGALAKQRAQTKLESEEGSAPKRSWLSALVQKAIPDASQVLIRDLSIVDGTLLVEDSVALYERYSHVTVTEITAHAEPFRIGERIPFHVNGDINPGDNDAWTLDADASYDLSENLLDVDARLTTFDPDIITSMLARPLRLAPKPPGPESEHPFQLTVDVKVESVPYWTIEATDVTGRVEFSRRVLLLKNIVGIDSGGDLTVNGTIRFESTEVHHELHVVLVDASFKKEIGQLLPPPWNEITARQSFDLSGKFRDPRGRAFKDALLGKSVEPAPGEYVRAQITLTTDVLDLDEIVETILQSDATPTDVEAVSTGWIDANFEVDIGRLRFRKLDFLDVAAKGTLHDSTIKLASLESTVENGGTAKMNGHLMLNEPGFRYDASLQLNDVHHSVVLRSFAQPTWGKRTGTANANLTLAGQGTTAATALKTLEGTLELTILEGRISDAPFLDILAKETGIEGFRDMELVDSGGKVTLSDSVLRTDQVRLGSEEARIRIKGKMGLDESLDLKVNLGFGPNSKRHLTTKGVLLPYQYDDEGWTEIPLFVTGTFESPTVIPDPAAIPSTALHAVPDTAKRLGSEGASVTGAVVGGAYGSVGAIAGGLGRMLTGRWGEGKEEQEEKSESAP